MTFNWWYSCYVDRGLASGSIFSNGVHLLGTSYGKRIQNLRAELKHKIHKLPAPGLTHQVLHASNLMINMNKFIFLISSRGNFPNR